jgi:hypothetical protein
MTSRFASPESLSSFDEGHWPSLLFRPNPWNRFPPSASYSSVTLRRPLKSIGHYLPGFALILLVTLFYVRGVSASATAVGFTFLLGILSASTIWGLGVSCMMSVAATLAFDYFFSPPVGSLDIADPQDWVALFSFVVAAVLGSSLRARIPGHSRQIAAVWKWNGFTRLASPCWTRETCWRYPRPSRDTLWNRLMPTPRQSSSPVSTRFIAREPASRKSTRCA